MVIAEDREELRWPFEAGSLGVVPGEHHCGVRADIASMNPVEQVGYFEVTGAQLYTVLHEVPDPIARVLLIGPFASERHSSYTPWVRWARYLAARRIECLRYDYRGIGESTGVFEEMSFENWLQDVELLADWLKKRSPEVPMVLHGLELGTLLAGKAFARGVGDVLLLWAAPANANQVLRATLLRQIAMDQAFKDKHQRRPVSDYLEQLEGGDFLEVEGYQWSGRLWRDSFKLELPAGMEDEGSALSTYNRPIRIVKLDKRAVPLVKGSAAEFEAINKDFSGLFADNFGWIAAVLPNSQGGKSEGSH